ncbi:protein ALP1-like [Macadamia integrifolia]|uniref:protein ALP1-like n=1 Tax=Macadamia integrifolia TaxID=60698 RepID=UPI001C52E7CD|nr:protein ALP1-like [Macadamia integrifolia]
MVTAVEQYKKLFLCKKPYRNETRRGSVETQRIIGHTDKTCRNMIRMSRKAFFNLCQVMRAKGLLYDTINVQVEEQVVIFLYAIGHNVKNRVLLHLFGHSGETISRYFNLVLGAVLKLYPVLLKPPSTITHERIAGNYKSFYPYFKDCIGAIDGSHIPAWVPIAQHQTFRDRKGNISQNILAVRDFDMKFTYILSGWEGPTSGSRILDDAIHREGEAKLPVPRGKFYLVDAGFTNQKGVQEEEEWLEQENAVTGENTNEEAEDNDENSDEDSDVDDEDDNFDQDQF